VAVPHARDPRRPIHHGVTPPCDTGPVSHAERPSAPVRLTLLRGGAGAQRARWEEPEDRRRRLCSEVASVLAGTLDNDLEVAPLALPLALSACMARHQVGPEGLIDAMLPLRGALLSVSDLDPSVEPVPLAVGEPRTEALRLAHYLYGLLTRAAASSALHRDALASAAAARLCSA
jgi:hypothetical protein